MSKLQSHVLKKFEEDISSWPLEQAHSALLLVNTVLSGEGDESAIKQLSEELTVGQFDIAAKVIEDIEKESEEKDSKIPYGPEKSTLLASIFQKVIFRFFPPSEVKEVCNEVTMFMQDNSSLSKDIIQKEVLLLAKDYNKTLYSICKDKLKPDQLALILITNVLGKHLGSGHYHIYRGVVNTSGQEMLESWHAAIQTLRDKGYYSDAEAEDDNKWIEEQIKKVG